MFVFMEQMLVYPRQTGLQMNASLAIHKISWYKCHRSKSPTKKAMRRELLWQKLANKLARRIASGRYPLGSLLPTELELVQSEKVSRNTVRAALQELKARGLIERQAHNGTRVISTGGASNFHQKLSSLRDLDEFGHHYGRRITDLDFVTADRKLAEAINCAVGSNFLQFVNIRTSDEPDDPAVVCTKVFINAAFGEVVQQAREHPQTLIITFIEDLFHKHCVQVKQSIQAVALPANIARILGATAGEPALRILRHYLDAKEQVLEISVSYHPGKRYAFNMTLGKSSR